MFKKRSRPQPRVRERETSPEEDRKEDKPEGEEEEESGLAVADLIELRKLRRARQGIDASKLTEGDGKKKKRRKTEDDDGHVDQGGLRKGAPVDDDDEDPDDKDVKARLAVRKSNFTQQTNTLDVDKHMMAYIEENMKKLRGAERDDADAKLEPADPYAELNRLADRYKVPKKVENEKEEGNVTNSLAMLTAIPEVDLGMDARLKNIEDTEKAKRQAAEARQDRKRRDDDEPIAGSRFFKPNHSAKSDADILRDAKREAMGMKPQEGRRPHAERPQMATDEMVMERFKKRMKR